MKLKKIIAGGICLLAFASCATVAKLNPEAQKVLVTTYPIKKECIFLGQINGYAETGWVRSGTDMQAAAIADLKNKALELKANVVQLETSAGNGLMHSAMGNAFKCP